MKQGVPFLNALTATFYLLLAALHLFIAKIACRPRRRLNAPSADSLPHPQPNYPRLFLRSCLFQYSLIGGILSPHKQHLLHELMTLAVYTNLLHHINHLSLLPLLFAVCVIPLRIALTALTNLINTRLARAQSHLTNQVQSELQIHPQLSSKVQIILIKSKVQIILISLYAFIGCLLLANCSFYLTNSISNAGELTLISFFAVLAIDQCAIRPAFTLLLLGVSFLLNITGKVSYQSNLIVTQICQELIEQDKLNQYLANEKRRKKTLASIIYDDVSEKQEVRNEEREMNFLSMRAKKRRDSEVEKIGDIIYLTSAQKQIFESDGGQTWRKQGRKIGINEMENDMDANDDKVTQGVTVHLASNEKNGILQEHEGNAESSYHNLKKKEMPNQFMRETMRKKTIKNTKKPNRRMLIITGDSPYLEYLPDMLKNLDKNKKHAQMHKENLKDKTIQHLY